MEFPIDCRVFSEITSNFNELTKNPAIYVEKQQENAENFKLIMKQLYDCVTKANTLIGVKTKSLPKLLTDGFDDEQIWQQIELQNKCAVPYLSTIIAQLKPSNIVIRTNVPVGRDGDSVARIATNNEYDSGTDSSTAGPKGLKTKSAHGKEYVFDGDSDSSIEDLEAFKDKLANGEKYVFDGDSDSSDNDAEESKKKPTSDEKYLYDGDSESSDEELEESKTKPANIKDSVLKDGYSDFSGEETKVSKSKPISSQNHGYKSVVDDQFFKLSALEEFLRVEDLKEEKGHVQASDDEDDIDLFQDIPPDNMTEPDDSELDDEATSETKPSKGIMYEDFFDAPESGDENAMDIDETSDVELSNKKNNGIKMKDISHSLSDVEHESQDLGDHLEDEKVVSCDSVSENTDLKENQKTAFELEQEKVKKKIEEYEKNLLKPLPWHLTGEVDASKRPVNSLVHQQADFDSNVKQDLVVDSTLNEKTEGIIKMAISNKAFSDVERKYKPTEEVIAYKKTTVLEQTKSKKGLAEVYEEDYLNRQKKYEEEEDPKHIAIKKLMDSLFPELQALFSHIPKPAVPEIKIVSNLPAITVEEVAPTSISDVNLLAPEEVKIKTGLVKGKSERTDTDRKHERRKKKLLQKLKQKEKEKEANIEGKPLSAKARKQEKIDTLKKLKQHRNVKIANMDDVNKVKSSKDFFSRLQDTVSLKVPKNANKLLDTPTSKKKRK